MKVIKPNKIIFTKILTILMIVILAIPSMGTKVFAAGGVDITISSTGDVSPNTYSDTPYVGVDGKKTEIGENEINSITTETNGVGNRVYGIKADSKTITIGSLSGGININCNNDSAYGIGTSNNSSLTLNSLGDLSVIAKKHAYGISSSSGSEVIVNCSGNISVENKHNSFHAFGIYSKGANSLITLRSTKEIMQIAVTTSVNSDIYSIYTLDNGKIDLGETGKTVKLSGNVCNLATLDLAGTTEVVTGNVVNSGTLNLAGTMKVDSGTLTNTGTIVVDMSFVDSNNKPASVTIIDCEGTASYGTYEFAEGKDYGYELSVVGNDLIATRTDSDIVEILDNNDTVIGRFSDWKDAWKKIKSQSNSSITIKLIKDITLTCDINVGGNNALEEVTLDLNNHVLNGDNQFAIKNFETLSIKDSSVGDSVHYWVADDKGLWILQDNKPNSGEYFTTTGGCITNLLAPEKATYQGHTYEYGAIDNQGNLNIDNVDLIGNNGGMGGALYNYGGNKQASIKNSNIMGNIANVAGGIANKSSLTIEDCKISYNVGIKEVGGIYNDDHLTLKNVEITGNITNGVEDDKAGEPTNKYPSAGVYSFFSDKDDERITKGTSQESSRTSVTLIGKIIVKDNKSKVGEEFVDANFIDAENIAVNATELASGSCIGLTKLTGRESGNKEGDKPILGTVVTQCDESDLNYFQADDEDNTVYYNGGEIILAKQLKVTGTTVDAKVYDGDTDATVNLGTVTSVIDGEDVTVSASGTFKDKNAGANKEVSVTYSISGTDAKNYIAPKTETINANISPKSLTVSGFTVSNKYYDGTNKAIVTNNGTLGNIVQGDDVNIDTVTANYIDDTIANDKQVTIQYSLKGNDKDNYTLVDQTTTSSILAIPSINKDKSNVNIDNQKFSITFTKGNTKDIVIDIDDTYSSACKAELYKDDTMVQECTCSQGSIKVTIPNSYVKTLAVGTHDFTLKVTNSNNLSYTYDLDITINNPVISPSYNVVKTGVDGTNNTLRLVSLLSLVTIAGVVTIKKRKH